MKKNNAFLKSSIIFISILLIISIVFLLWEMNPFIKEATVSFEKGSPASSANYNSCAVVLIPFPASGEEFLKQKSPT